MRAYTSEEIATLGQNTDQNTKRGSRHISEENMEHNPEINRKLTILQELLSCCYPLYIWQYDADCQLLHTDYPYPGLLSPWECCEEIIYYGQKSASPLILSGPEGVLWIAAFERNDNQLIQAHVMGPAFPFDMSLHHLEESLNTLHISIEEKKSMIQAVHQIPVITYANLMQYTTMLHYCISGEKINLSSICHLQTKTDNRQEDSRDSGQTKHNRNHVWQMEQAMLDMIREGNLNYQSILHNARSISTGVGITVGDPLRQAKINATTFITLCVRATIQGGVSPEFAYSHGDKYLQEIELSKSVTGIANMIHAAYDDFVHAVHDSHFNPELSPQIRQCIDYIESHITSELSTELLAKTVGYSKYYLTKKFKQETGESISDYIKNKRIEYAKVLLKSTDIDIQLISEKLHFCTRNHFTDTFHKITGTTPAQYRNDTRKES